MSEQSVDRKTAKQSLLIVKQHVSKVLDHLWAENMVFPYDVKMREGGIFIQLAELVKEGGVKTLGGLQDGGTESKSNTDSDGQ